MKHHELPAHKEFNTMLEVCENDFPELYIKLCGGDEDITEFHHQLWELPFYHKIVEVTRNINTTKYLYLSDKNCSRSSLFFIYELSYSKLSLKGTFNIEKRIVHITETSKEWKKYLKHLIGAETSNDVPDSVWSYTSLL